MKNMLTEWEKYLGALYAKTTAKAYSYEVRRFRQAIGKSPLEVTSQEIQGFITSEAERLAAPTIQRFVAALRAFYHWAIQHDLLMESPLNKVQVPRLGLRLPKILTRAEVDQLLSAELPTRDQAMLLLMLDAGLRLVEVSRLLRADVELTGRTIRALGKGNKERIIPLSERLHGALEDWLYGQPGQPTDPLFPGYHGEELKPRAIGYRISHIGESAGLERRLSPHLLRHTFATRLLQHGVNLRVVQELLGHSNVATTQIYTHVVSQDMADAIQRLN